MRAMRFASVLGFEIEKETHDALLKNAWLLKNVSSERICTELFKLLCGKNALNVLRDYSEVITVVIPELKPAIGCAQNTPWHCCDVYEHIVRAVDFAPNDSMLRLAMLLHDIGKPYVKKRIPRGVIILRPTHPWALLSPSRCLKGSRFQTKFLMMLPPLCAGISPLPMLAALKSAIGLFCSGRGLPLICLMLALQI